MKTGDRAKCIGTQFLPEGTMVEIVDIDRPGLEDTARGNMAKVRVLKGDEGGAYPGGFPLWYVRVRCLQFVAGRM